MTSARKGAAAIRADRPFRVYVFRHDDPGRMPKWTAYTLWVNPAWSGCRVVDVVASDGREAKRRAIAIEKAKEARA